MLTLLYICSILTFAAELGSFENGLFPGDRQDSKRLGNRGKIVRNCI